tara:strand:+ start:564 stop:674 length:111 start_codon:yes stop_codon:yes gene_type:complete
VKSKEKLKIGKLKKPTSERTNKSDEKKLKPKIIFDL